MNINSAIRWTSFENYILINPKFSQEVARDLIEMARLGGSDLKNHIFILSSGTTANSAADLKWVALSKDAVLASAEAVNHRLGSTSKDIWLHGLPDFHVGGLGIRARAYLSGARVIEHSKWNPIEFKKTLESNQATLTALVPTQIFDLVKENLRCPHSLRAVFVGGGAIAPSLYSRAIELGWPVLTAYGMSETCSQVAAAERSSSNDLPLMRVLPHLEVELDSESRVKIRGKSLFTRYIFKKDGQVIQNDPKEDGWFTSQDRGELHSGGLKILGRIGEFIKIGGEGVELGRLRAILEDMKMQCGIKEDIALIPVPDERLGYVIHLMVAAKSAQEKFQSFVDIYNQKVLGFERIRKTHFVEFIPRTSLGKLILNECLRAIPSP